MPNMSSTFQSVPDSVIIEKETAYASWKLVLDDNLTNTHVWTYGDGRDREIRFWFDLDYRLYSAVEYRRFDTVTATPIRGTRDLTEILEWLYKRT